MGRKPLGPWVVAGVDGSAGTSAVVDIAAAEAATRRLRLRVVGSSPAPASGCAADTGALAARVEVNLAVAEAASRAHLAWPDLTVRTLVAAGDLAGTLIRESRAAGLVVVGNGRHPSPVGARVAAHAHCPTVVVPSHLDEAAGVFDAPVMVGVAAAGLDDDVIRFAFEEAAARGVPVRAVHVWSAPAAADRRLAEALAGWAEKYPQVPVERVPLYDVDPANALARAAAAQCGLVVIGAGLYARFGGQRLGTVTRTLIERAGRPVCVVRLAD